MVSLTYAITKTPIIFSLLTPNNNNSSKNTSVSSVPSLPPRSKRKHQELTISRTTTQSQQPTTNQPKPKPSVAEIERAIGAGVFRDRDTDSDSEQRKTLFDSILSNSIGKSEGSVEKKLCETGEWILDRTEDSSSGSAGKQILKGVFLLILPMWMLSFLVASGLIKLPFDTPFLDDLIM